MSPLRLFSRRDGLKDAVPLAEYRSRLRRNRLRLSSCSLLSLNSRGHWFPIGIGVMEFDPIFSCTKLGLHYAVLVLHDQ